MGQSAVVRACSVSAIAAVVLVLLGTLLGTTVATAQPPIRQSSVAVRAAAAEPTPDTVSTDARGVRNFSDGGDDCALRCAPECGGLDRDCVALNATAGLRTAEDGLVMPQSRTGAIPVLGVLRQQHRPAPSLLVLSITRI